jgi:hypothetical protein
MLEDKLLERPSCCKKRSELVAEENLGKKSYVRRDSELIVWEMCSVGKKKESFKFSPFDPLTIKELFL